MIRRLFFVAAVAALGGAGLAIYHWIYASPADVHVEVAVFFPGPNERTWTDFVEGVRLAAAESGLAIEEDAPQFSCSVATQPKPIRFRWYPEVGARRIQRRVGELCRQPKPPIAFVGSSNSELTRCLGSEIRRAADKEKTPVLLMTGATSDDLITLIPERTFRFGFNNSRQAKDVVARLNEFIQKRQQSTPTVKAIVVRVADDEFSVDLAAQFARELSQNMQAQLQSPPARFQAKLVAMERGKSDDRIWTLGTATGRYDDPSPSEWELARQIKERVIVDLESQWVVALPAGTSVYRRLSFAISSTLKEIDDRAISESVRNQLVMISGDSLDYYAFREAALNQLLPDESPAPVIFFGHADPLDRTVAPPPNRHIPTRALNREVARALLAVVPTLGGDVTSAKLAQALVVYKSVGQDVPMFDNGERRAGGGAIVAIPRPSKQDYELLLPAAWRKGA